MAGFRVRVQRLLIWALGILNSVILFNLVLLLHTRTSSNSPSSTTRNAARSGANPSPFRRARASAARVGPIAVCPPEAVEDRRCWNDNSRASSATLEQNDAGYFRAEVKINRMQMPPPYDLEVGTSENRHDFIAVYKHGYPVWAVSDVFLRCGGKHGPRVVAISREYRRTAYNFDALQIKLLVQGRPAVPLRRVAFSTNGQYESSVIGEFDDRGEDEFEGGALVAACAAGAASVDLAVTYVDPTNSSIHAERIFEGVEPSPEPPRTRFAIVAVFNRDRWLLPLWIEWYRVLGVGTFYLFPNEMNDAAQDANLVEVRRMLQNVSAHVVLFDWRMLHWILTDTGDNTFGQPMAINNAFQRFRHLHEFMLFYDLDEFAVFPKHASLDAFVDDYRENISPIVCLVTMCVWGKLNLSESEDLEGKGLEVFVNTPLIRHHEASSREKYMLNTTAAEVVGIAHINIHGVYSHNQPMGAPGKAAFLYDRGSSVPGWHLHLQNMPREAGYRLNDAREVFLPKEKQVLDKEVASMIYRAVSDRARRGKEKPREKRDEGGDLGVILK